MSFFIKGKRSRGRGKAVENGDTIPNKKFKDDELTSSESEYDDKEDAEIESEEEEETAQEKRLRLAKIYLQEIEKEEKERLEQNEGTDIVSHRLKEDYLKQTGKFRSEVADQYVKVELESIEVLRCKEHKKVVTCLCISSDNLYIFTGSKDGSIVQWSIGERKKIGSIPFKRKNLVSVSSTIDGHSFPITCIAISDDSKFLAAGDESNDIQIWNPTNLTHIHTLKSHRNCVTGLVFRKDSHQLYSCSKDKSVKVWTLDEMAFLETLFGHQDCIMAIDALSRERTVTAGGSDNSLRIWKVAEESQLIFNGTGNLDCVKLINEEHFISAGDAGELCIWGAMKKKPLCCVKDAHGSSVENGQPAWINCVASLVNTDLVASGSSDGSIRLWKVSNGCKSISPLFTIPITGFVNTMSFTSDGKYLIAGVGQEHRCGRWFTIKEARNGIVIIPLKKSS
ncbi:U3 small nuclear riboprotein factor 55K [Carabus blaptoides fortunei]